MLVLAMFYDSVSALPAFEAATRGLNSAVVGVLSATAYRLGQKTLGSPVASGIALCAFSSTALLGIPTPAIVVTAGMIGVSLLSTQKAGLELGRGKGAPSESP
jgi:chromate transport protein ChrA